MTWYSYYIARLDPTRYRLDPTRYRLDQQLRASDVVIITIISEFKYLSNDFKIALQI